MCPGNFFVPCVEFILIIIVAFIVWAIANARNLKRRAHNLPETLASFAVKCGFASGLAGRLLYDAAMHPVIDWPNRIHGRTWLLANGIGLAIYLVVYLGKRD